MKRRSIMPFVSPQQPTTNINVHFEALGETDPEGLVVAHHGSCCTRPIAAL
jgi:hypothetical protein